MESSLLALSSQISTPLGLGGLFSVIIFLIIKSIIGKDIFPQLTKIKSFDLIKIIINKLFILSLIAMILGFASYVIDKNNFSGKKESDQYKEIKEVQGKISYLINNHYNNWNKDKVSFNKIIESAPYLGKKILTYSDSDLSSRYKVIKYSYASYNFMMAASVLESKAKSIRYADLSIKNSNHAIELIDSLKGQENNVDYRYFLERGEKALLLYTIAVSSAIKVKNGQKEFVDETKNSIKNIPQKILIDNPLEKDAELAWFSKNYK